MSEDNCHILESVIHITEERDKKSIEKVLLDTISELIDFEALILIRVPHIPTVEYVEMSISIPRSEYMNRLNILSYDHGDPHVQRDNSISQCIESHEVVLTEYKDSPRLIFPVISDNVVECVLDIYGHNSTNGTKKLIAGLIRIYSNFLAILHDNEHDTLTGLLNRKSFDLRLSELLNNEMYDANYALPDDKERRHSTSSLESWIGIFDIDHFKRINDNFGHIYGDEVLLLFADLMRHVFRSSDLMFRFGGEEFIVVLNQTTEEQAFIVFDRFRQRLEDFDFPQVGQATVSIGMIRAEKNSHPTTLIEQADQALYYAKEHGRNQVQNYHTLIAAGLLKVRETKDDIELF